MGSILHHAVRCKSVDVVKFLVSNKAKCLVSNKLFINTVDNRGFTPLHYAILNNDTRCAAYLIKNGADTSCRSNNLHSILHVSLMQKNKAFALELLRLSVFFLKKQHKLDAMINSKNRFGSTPLINAVMRNNLKAVELLIDCGAQLTSRNKNNLTALDIAKAKNFTEIIELLTNSLKKVSGQKRKRSE